MKKITLLMSLIVLAMVSFGQATMQVQAPSSLAGNYVITFAPTGTWGVSDLNDPANSVTGTCQFVDSTFVDSLACLPPVDDLTGNIAVVYRGSCQFGSKLQL